MSHVDRINSASTALTDLVRRLGVVYVGAMATIEDQSLDDAAAVKALIGLRPIREAIEEAERAIAWCHKELRDHV